jgi:2-isopropylmalate synthase
VRLSDYKVRVIDADAGTTAKVRVLIESTNSEHELWGTVGSSDNIIEASWLALRDSIIYGIYRARERKARESGG